MKNLVMLLFVVMATSCSVGIKTRGEDGKPGEPGKSANSEQKGEDGKNGKNGEDKTFGIKL